jgi:hypothetical protein
MPLARHAGTPAPLGGSGGAFGPLIIKDGDARSER